MTSSVTAHSPVTLPPRLTEKLPTDKGILKRLLKRHEVLSDLEIVYFVKSRSRVDVGSWIHDRRIHVAATPAHLILFAGGKRPLAEQLAYEDLYESVYNHVTGTLVLAPDIDERINTLRVSPVDGYQFLSQIYNQDS